MKKLWCVLCIKLEQAGITYFTQNCTQNQRITFSNRNNDFFLNAHENMKKQASKVAELAQIQPKSQFLFHKNLPPRDFSLMTLMAGKPSQLDKFSETGWRWVYYTGIFIWGVKCLWSKKWLWTIKVIFSNLFLFCSIKCQHYGPSMKLQLKRLQTFEGVL